VVAFGTPGKYVRAAVRELRAEGAKVGYVRPITLFPFPTEIVVAATANARTVAVYENNQGQMIDDVRLAVLGRAPVRFIGGLSLDSSGFGIAPDLDVSVLKGRIEEVLGG
jgi:2-oxoglutarate ferredoxin oxidoreductase subunit alpha